MVTIEQIRPTTGAAVAGVSRYCIGIRLFNEGVPGSMEAAYVAEAA